jgi:hypothetical protein
MMSTTVESIAVGLALLLAHRATTAAQLPASADSTRGYWVTGALGVSRVPSAAASGVLVAALGGVVQRGGTTGSLRWDSLGNGVGSTEIRALSLLGGVASTTNGAGFWALSAGVTGLRQQDCTSGCGLFADTPRQTGPARTGVGLMAAGNAALRLGHNPGASLGFTGFVSVNTAQSFAGIALEVGIGRWR